MFTLTVWDHETFFLKPVIEGHFKGTMGGPLKLRTILGAPMLYIGKNR